MVGHVQHNGRIHSPRLHQLTQSSGKTGHQRNRIIRRIKSMPSTFHRSGITNPQKRAVDAQRTVNQQASTKQSYEGVWGACQRQAFALFILFLRAAEH